MKSRVRVKTMIGFLACFYLPAVFGQPGEAPPVAGGPPSEEPASTGYSADKVGEATFEIDPDTGKLIVIADDETNAYIQQIIDSLDKPVPQVLIKVLFLEVTHGNDLDLGLEASLRYGGKTVGIDTDGDGRPDEDVVQFEDTLETIFGVAAAADGAFWRVLREDFDMTIHALAQVGKLEVLSRPSILARNNEQAVITLGQEVPFITNSRVTQDGQIINTVTYEDVGIILDVTPHITSDGLVEMVVAPEISTISGETVTVTEGISAPIIAKRAAQTTVVVPDGMTVVIGGLMEDNETELVRKVPLVGDLPWIGTLFRRTIKSKTKTELIIFLTPHVVMRTANLEPLSASESRNARLVPKAFTEPELDQHLEAYEKLTVVPLPPAPKPGLWEQTRDFLDYGKYLLK